jgi:hypothetical protein
MSRCCGVPVRARLSEGGLSVVLAHGTDAGRWLKCELMGQSVSASGQLPQVATSSLLATLLVVARYVHESTTS